MAQQKFGEIVVSGQTVEIFKMISDKEDLFCSCVTLKNSAVLKESVLGYPTFRDGDKIGFSYNEGQTEAQRLIDAIHQAVNAINKWKEIMDGV